MQGGFLQSRTLEGKRHPNSLVLWENEFSSDIREKIGGLSQIISQQVYYL